MERIAELISQDDMLGVTSIINDREVKDDFIDACEYIFKKNRDKSTIGGSMAESLKGKCGDCSYSWKTVLSPLWVSPLTTLLWFFNLDGVANNKLYYNEILEASEVLEIDHIISRFWSKNRKGIKKDIPI